MIRFTCPTCKTILQALPEQAGAIITCSKCKTQMKVALPPANPALGPKALIEQW